MKKYTYTILAALALAACSQIEELSDPDSGESADKAHETIRFAAPAYYLRDSDKSFVINVTDGLYWDLNSVDVSNHQIYFTHGVWAESYPKGNTYADSDYERQTEFDGTPLSFLLRDECESFLYNGPIRFYDPNRTYSFIGVFPFEVSKEYYRGQYEYYGIGDGESPDVECFDVTYTHDGLLRVDGLPMARESNGQSGFLYLVSDRFTVEGDNIPIQGVQFHYNHIFSRLRFAVWGGNAGESANAPRIQLDSLSIFLPSQNQTCLYEQVRWEGPSDDDVWRADLPMPLNPTRDELLSMSEYSEHALYFSDIRNYADARGIARLYPDNSNPEEQNPYLNQEFVLAPTRGGRYLYLKYHLDYPRTDEDGETVWDDRETFEKIVRLDSERLPLKQGYIHTLNIYVGGDETINFNVESVADWVPFTPDRIQIQKQ